MTPPVPVPRADVLAFCERLGYSPDEVAGIECVLVEPRQVIVTVRQALDRRATISYTHPVDA